MAHFALLDDNNIVLNVLYVDNNDMLDGEGNESEALGIAQCREGLGKPNARLVRTSYSHSIRRRYAGVGFTYDEERDVFLTPKEWPSWVLNTTTLCWEPPTAMPELTEEQRNVGSHYVWNEETTSWDFVDMTPPSEESSSE
tara:strand:- start:223 stop:645 length:423 start_codon:yes stop_codon:yes gene_type:complete